MQNTLAQTATTLSDGAHIYTALVCFHRGSGQANKEVSRRRLFGARANSLVNWFGIGAGHMSCAYFGGALSPREILSKHTLFGYYSLGLSEKRSVDWEASLSRGDYARPTRYIQNARGAIVSESLKWCPTCAQEDIDVRGYAAWKVAHQLPFVSVCPRHGEVLLDRCEYCGRPLDDGRAFRLPEEACSQCGRRQFATSFKSDNPAVIEFARQCASLIDTQGAIFRPENWASLMRVAKVRIGSPRKMVALVQAKLLNTWKVGTIEEVGSALRIACHPKFFLQVIHGHLTTSPLAIQILVLRALEDELPDIRFQAESKMSCSSPSGAVGFQDFSAEQLHEHFHSAQQLGACDQLALVKSNLAEYIRVAGGLGISRSHAMKLVSRIKDVVRRDAEIEMPPIKISGSRREEKEELRREKWRSQVQKVLEAEPTINRTVVWHRCKSAVLWLIKHDREWLDQNVPVKHGGMPYAERPSRRRLPVTEQRTPMRDTH